MRGWIYIITNESMPGLLKVGFTMKDPKERAKELAGTGIPTKYNLEYEAFVDNPYKVELLIHNHLKYANVGKEWFKVFPKQAIKVARSLIVENSSIHYEGYFGTSANPPQIVARRIKVDGRPTQSYIAEFKGKGKYFCPNCLEKFEKHISSNLHMNHVNKTKCPNCHEEAYLIEASSDNQKNIQRLFEEVT